MKPSALIFDFDGTIADTYRYIIRISNQMAEEFGYKKIADEDIEKMKNHTAKEMIKVLEIPLLKVPTIISTGKRRFMDNIDSIDIFSGLHEALIKLKSFDIPIGILSSNSQDNIEQLLEIKNIDVFDFVHTTSKVWSKNTYLKKLIEKKNFDIANVIYIGDETRDISAARKTGTQSAAVTWGYNSADTLAKHNPDFLFHSPEDLLNLIPDSQRIS